MRFVDMEGPTFVVDAIVDRHSVLTLIDGGSQAYASMSISLANRLRLPRISFLSPRAVDGVGGGRCTVTHAVRFDIDLEGYEQTGLLANVIPRQPYELILGMPWTRHQNAVILPRDDILLIRSAGATINRAGAAAGRIGKGQMPVQIAAAPYTRLAKQSRRRSNADVEIFAASFADIEKALRQETEKSVTTEDLRKQLPAQYADLAEAFAANHLKGATAIPPHGENIGMDMTILLQRGEKGVEMEVPWGPLYSLSRDEVLCGRLSRSS